MVLAMRISVNIWYCVSMWLLNELSLRRPIGADYRGEVHGKRHL